MTKIKAQDFHIKRLSIPGWGTKTKTKIEIVEKIQPKVST